MDLTSFYSVCADLYDADFAVARSTEDVDFYTALAGECGGEVLEMGCGSGRVLLPTARAGVAITGLDASAGMLDRLRRHLEAEPMPVRRRVRLAEGDVRRAELGRTFPLVTAPFRVVQHLLSRADQRSWLRTVARHLAPGGELVFDVFQTDFGRLAEPLDEIADVDRTDPATGRRVRRLVSTAHTPERQRFLLHLEWRIDGPDGRQIERRGAETEIRWFTRAELENLLELEGFTVLDVWGDFHRTPHGPGAEEIVVRARRG